MNSSDSIGLGPQNGKKSGKDSVSTIKPQVPPPGSGYMEGSQYVADYYQFNGVYLPEDSAKHKYLMFMTSNVSSDKFETMYQKYCFRRVVCGDGDINALESAHFSRNQLLISIGNGGGCGFPYPSPGPGLLSNWRHLVDTYTGNVLGYMYDEPSGWTNGDTMKAVADYIHTRNGSLWLDDYDTGVISSVPYFAYHNCHLADDVMLPNGDYIMNDADNAQATNGWDGIGCYIVDDFNEFQYWFGAKFNSIFTMNGFPNEASLVSWVQSHPSISNYAIYLTSSWSWGDLDSFMGYADQAGFLGHQYQVYYYTYVCQTNSVKFTPPSAPEAGAGKPAYYGVWTNNAYYTGPVDPSTPGAVLCWAFQSGAATSQTVNVY